MDYEIKQSMLLHSTDDDFCKGVLLFDKQNNVHVTPISASKFVCIQNIIKKKKIANNNKIIHI